MQIGEVAAVHRQNIIESGNVRCYHLACPQIGNAIAAKSCSLYGGQYRRLADISIERSGRIDGEAEARPARRAMLRKTPSAIGERQMLAVQTKRMAMGTVSSNSNAE